MLPVVPIFAVTPVVHENGALSSDGPPGPSSNSQVLPNGSLDPATASGSLVLASDPPHSQPVLSNGAGENIELSDVIIDLDSEPKKY